MQNWNQLTGPVIILDLPTGAATIADTPTGQRTTFDAPTGPAVPNVSFLKQSWYVWR